MSLRLHNLKVKLIRLAKKFFLVTRKVRHDRPWARIDAWANGLVEINGRYFDLCFEMPFDTPQEWLDMWDGYIVACIRGDGPS